MYKKLKFVLLAFFIITISTTIFKTSICYSATTKVGQLIFIEGTVQIKRANTTSWFKAEEFDPLYNNDEIKTLKKSTAEIEFTHGDIILISSSSHFKIQNYTVNNKQRIADFFLSIGKTWANVKKSKGKGSKFKINTPAGAASVRGTLFVIEILPKDLTKPPTPENLKIAIAAVDGKIDIDTQFDKQTLNPLKEVNFMQKDQKLIIQNINPAYLNEAKNIMQIINQLKSQLINEVKSGENTADNKKNEHQKVNIIDYTKISQIINQAQQDPNLDSDGDGLTDILELTLGSNIHEEDTDGDGMKDKQEYDNLLKILVDDADDDADNDGIKNIDELSYGFNPQDASDGGIADADSDGIYNKDEITWNFDPRDASDGSADTDGDGIENHVEIQYGLNPRDVLDATTDKDGDGINNKTEIELGLNINDPNDTGGDFDSDGLPDLLEVQNSSQYGSDPKTANPDIDEDNIKNADEVTQENLGFPMDPFTKSQFSDRVDSNYKNINSNYAAGSVKKIDFTGITDQMLGIPANTGINATTVGDGIGDFDEIILKKTFKDFYGIDDTTDAGKKLLLDPTYYNLDAIVKRVTEYRDAVDQLNAAWTKNGNPGVWGEDFQHHWYTVTGGANNGNLNSFNPAIPNLTTFYNPKNWTLFEIVNLSKILIVLDGSFADSTINAKAKGDDSSSPLANTLLTNKAEDIGGLLFGMYKIMDPDSDYIKNCDEEHAFNNMGQWPRILDPMVEDKLADWEDLITKDNPIYIISLDNSIIAPFTGQLIVNDSSSLTDFPHALLKSNLEFINPSTGIKQLCPINNQPMLKYPIPGGKFIYLCPREPVLAGDVFPPPG